MRRRSAVLVLPIAMCLVLVSCTSKLPVVYSSASAVSGALSWPGSPPAGANDWKCRPSAAHPNPVVLVHGTFANMAVNWATLSPLLKNNGYCVFALNYGGLIAGQMGGTGPIAASAAELSVFVDKVLVATGAAEVDIVGHSQGGMMPRYYLKHLGGADKVRALVALSPSNHGTTLLGIAHLATFFPWTAGLIVGSWCASCMEQIRSSDFIDDLNAGGETVPGVDYTVIQTRFDEVVTPYTSAFLDGPNVRNITVQDRCALDLSDHISVAFSRVSLTHVLNALDPANPRSVPCVPVAPVLGG